MYSQSYVLVLWNQWVQLCDKLLQVIPTLSTLSTKLVQRSYMKEIYPQPSPRLIRALSTPIFATFSLGKQSLLHSFHHAYNYNYLYI